ncbi:gluconolaconase [bacterium]|nr:MAG: gluconolaconase [bacterium]
MTLAIPFLAMLLTNTAGASFYPSRLEDPKAVYLTDAKGDGVADDSDAIQKAIDAVPGQGILFVPEGRYRLTKTITVWPGVRVIGYGPRRPTFLLADNTPGYAETEKLMVFFAGRRGTAEQPAIPAGTRGGDFGLPNEANPGTFYSAMSNIDLEVGVGNPSAVGVRGRYAQHCYLAHMDFRLRSGLAGVHDIGNEADDLRFFGGEYGIITRTPSPGWQFTLMDSHFEGQSKAAILTRVTGLTLVRPSFRNVPTAVEVDADHSEQLWIEDGRMEDVSGPALMVSREKSLRTQINVENVACRNVPTFALFRESGTRLPSPLRGRRAGGEGQSSYIVRSLSHGLHYKDLATAPKVETRFDAKPTLLPEPKPGVAFPSEGWANLKTLGAKGDGRADDTEVLRKSIAEHRVIYLPQGRYRVTDTILLRSDTILIGLNPITTQIVISDATLGFGANGRLPFAGSAKALLETPKDGTNVVSGIGLDTGGNNPKAVAALWKAGKDSLMDDVKFVGGHGSNVPIYNADRTGDPDPARRWDSQYPSLWVTDGGGGVFKNLWTASTFASAGMLVTDTTTEGRVYEMSSEHHVRNEVVIRDSANWSFIALQTEEERGESSFALPLEIERCRDITVANLNMYRVVSVAQPFPTAVRVNDSENVRFRGVHCYSNAKVSFDNVLTWNGVDLRQREFAYLNVAGEPLTPGVDRRVQKLATGFTNISGGAVAPNGDFYFVDARWHRIYRWDVAKKTVTTVSDAPLSPVNLLFDNSGNLMVVSYAGKGVVYALRPDGAIELLQAQPSTARAGATPVLPVTDWILDQSLLNGGKRPFHYVSPDGSTYLPTSQDFVDGTLTWGVKLMDTIRSFGFAKATPGKPFYVTEESGMRTYAVDVAADGTSSNPRLFAEQGGESATVGPDGRVYLAAGQVYVYSSGGKLVDTIRVPERPTQVLFGGADGKTLFICARSSLYAVRM